MEFGKYIREVREKLRKTDTRFSLRQVATRIGVEPAYLSKIERSEVPPPSEQTILKLADELNEQPDLMLALAGKVATELQQIIRKRPQLFAELLRTLREVPDSAVVKLVRVVKDGDW